VHAHEFADAEAALRPKASRLPAEDLGTQAQAALSGRHEVLDGAGILGLQRAVGNAGVSSVLGDEQAGASVQDVLSSGGSPMAGDVREDMESRLGHDFSDVRVHTGGDAHDSAVGVGAHAYTVGSDIVFQRDAYDPASDSGRTVLAHELTHVVQQRSGPVDGSDNGDGLRVSDPSDRFEREAANTAEKAVAAPAPVQRLAEHEDHPGHDAAAEGLAVQRAESGAGEAPDEELPEEEMPAAQTFVQRDEDEELEEPQG
jgi:hypothetical protein